VERGNRKTITGTVVTDKMDKSRIVSVTRRVKHPLYKKYIMRTSKFMAHDENNESNVGDTVAISETRPLSRRKRWRIIEIVERAK
jgi:small subunit ribosomal protein S17